jgi:hypothetical protein
VQRDRPGDSLEGEIAVEGVSVGVLAQAERAVGHGRMGQDVEVLGRAQVLVALWVVVSIDGVCMVAMTGTQAGARW